MHPTASILSFCVAVACANAQQPEFPPTGFEALDVNGNGYISADEASSRRGLSELFIYFDRNLDGRLSNEEYERLLQDAAHSVENTARKEKVQ